MLALTTCTPIYTCRMLVKHLHTVSLVTTDYGISKANAETVTCPSPSPEIYPDGNQYYNIGLLKVQEFIQTKPGCWKRVVKWLVRSEIMVSTNNGTEGYYWYPTSFPTEKQAIEYVIKKEEKEVGSNGIPSI